jgi:hypothetical protein
MDAGQKFLFDLQGFLVVKNALSPAQVMPPPLNLQSALQSDICN